MPVPGTRLLIKTLNILNYGISKSDVIQFFAANKTAKAIDTVIACPISRIRIGREFMAKIIRLPR